MQIFQAQPEGKRFLTKENQGYLSDYSSLHQAYNDNAVLEAIAVSCDCNHNLIVDLNGKKGIIPRLEGALGISEGETRDIALIAKVNKPVCFKITGFGCDQNGKDLVLLSRKAVQEDCRKYYINELRCGDIIPAVITHLDNFGCFADIGCGICSLIPIDAISVSRISHPSDRFSGNTDILAVVKAKDEKGRILLTHKELLGTWEQNARLFSAGETVSGVVRSVEDYGIFVELTPNLAGLAEPRENVKVGQKASIYIKSLIPEKMKIKLIIVDSFETNGYPQQAEKMQYFLDDSTCGTQKTVFCGQTDQIAAYLGTQACHIDRWQYSPPGCAKQIETNFEQLAYAY